jgi:hypothetical protein
LRDRSIEFKLSGAPVGLRHARRGLAAGRGNRVLTMRDVWGNQGNHGFCDDLI